MTIRRLTAAGWLDIAFFALFLSFAWAGIDTRLIYHWQGPVFSTIPGFLSEQVKHPGGVLECTWALLAQAYTSRAWGAVVVTAQAAAAAALTQAYFTGLAGRPLPLLRFVPAVLLLYYLNLYYNRTPMALALLLGLAFATLFVHLSRRWRSEAALLGVSVAMLAAVYYAGGAAMMFFVPAAGMAGLARRRRRALWVAWLLLAAALPAAVEWLKLIQPPESARYWFLYQDAPRATICWSLYLFFALGTAVFLLRRRPAGARAAGQGARSRMAAVLAAVLPLLALGSVMAASYRFNGHDRRLAQMDYGTYEEDWPAVIDAARRLPLENFEQVSRYEVNLALHESNRLADEMFRFPQSGPLMLDIREVREKTFLPYILMQADMCLRLGRVNDAERLGSEAMIYGGSNPRMYRLLARIYAVKGQIAAARKFLTALSYDAGSGAWARHRLRELDRDPGLAGDERVQLLRRRRLQKDDMLAVWQRADRPDGDMERLLLDQLEQDPSNRMAFEFLMGSYLTALNLEGASALMPHIKDMTGPAYVRPDGQRRTPRHYQEAMAIYAGMTGKTVRIEGFEIEPETLQRMATFRLVASRSPSKEAARQATWDNFRDTYFFYVSFGPGDYR